VATASQSAKHIFISTSRFRDLVSNDTIKHKPPGQYVLDEVREQYILNAQEKMAGRGGEGGAALTKQRAKLAAAQTAMAEFRNAQLQGGFVDMGLATRKLIEMFSVMREVALGMPGKTADSLTPYTPKDRAAIYEILRREIYAMLETLSDPDKTLAEVAKQKESNR
jgi:hypothetical protein